LHGKVLNIMYQVIVRIRQMLYKVSDKTTNTHVGMYEFEGKMYSILFLVQLKSEFQAKFLAQEQHLINNKFLTNPALLETLSRDYAIKK